MSNPKVSIVVPVYNVEDYICRCIDSLINQTFKEIEIIVINDGSFDKSSEILNEYASNYKMIKVIDQNNSGVSHCRNVGISVAIGEFIVFVDSDDWIDKDMIKIMYEKAKVENIDLVMCTYIREFGNYSKEKKFSIPQITMYEGEEVKLELLRKLVGPIGEELVNPEYLDALGTVWAKMYKLSILKDNELEFVDLKIIGSGEDTLFNIYAFNYINKAILINIPMYHYWKNNKDSITSRYIKNFKEKRKIYFEYIKKALKDNNLNEDFKKALNNRIAISVLGMGIIECSDGNNISTLDKIKNIEKILNENYIVEAYTGLEIKYFPIHWKIFYFFNKKKLALLSFMVISIIELIRKK
ncbi:MAG: glycosyltransferase [Romboutsia sp.]